MKKLLNLAKWGITLGSEPQNFLGASWIKSFLGKVSDKNKRKWALRLVSLSPHYFLDENNPRYEGLSGDQYLEAAHAHLIESRKGIYSEILENFLAKNAAVLEYGCGPGYLASAVAPHVSKIFACDISSGAIACARILNSAENLRYLSITEGELEQVEDSQLDAVYSFAVIQHLTDEVFELVLKNCRRMLKPGGKIVFHIQLKDDVWRTESDWNQDSSVTGKLKYKYGLHCFGRTIEEHKVMVEKTGFGDVEFVPLQELVGNDQAEAESQAIMTATRLNS
ncbi:MAG: methyltransferase domain-containing protein [Pyrinomonadaceae bacterium]